MHPKVQPLPCSGHHQHPWVLRAITPPLRGGIPKADPKSGSPKPTGTDKAGAVLTSSTGCRDKPSGGCRAPRRRRHPPTLRGKGSTASPVSSPPNPACPRAVPMPPSRRKGVGGSHLAGGHPAAPSPTPARATPAAKTPKKTLQGFFFLVERSHGAARPRLQGPRGGGWERPPPTPLGLVNHCRGQARAAGAQLLCSELQLPRGGGKNQGGRVGCGDGMHMAGLEDHHHL